MMEVIDREEQQELYEHYRFVVDKGQSPERIDRFLAARIANVSRTKVQYAAEAGNILVNQQKIKPSYKVKPGDEISVLLTFPPREQEIIPENIPLDIVYEDEDIVVVNKEAGMVVHPAYGNFTGTLINALYYRYKDLPLFQQGDLRPGLVHRIDKDTSGILVVAKNELSLNRLARQFYEHTIERHYVALVWGTLKENTGTIRGNVGRSPHDRKIMTVFSDGSQGKHAVTHYRVLEHYIYVSLVDCWLETGRTHQIRVHFKHIGHPLFNDAAYGGDKILKGTTFSKYRQFVENCFQICPRQALHARSLAFDHPTTRQRMYFEAPLPADMAQLVERWKEYALQLSKQL
ncbi:MAG TPA: RluA family pseudouridine synthase [Bacteroidales bacterium]|nr:RluA family pseudouridine synthase [Bacteroidales bacterium]HPO65714.1 RluA family pseudouridine synthase [Bacteroidales bacterium]